MTMREKSECFYCGKPGSLTPGPDQLTKDHVFPVSLGGGGGAWSNVNIVPACLECNGLKGNMHPRDWFWFVADSRKDAFVERLCKIFPKDILKIKRELQINIQEFSPYFSSTLQEQKACA